MEFKVTRMDLERLSMQDSCTPEDILNFFYDFCKETKVSPSTVKTNNIDLLMKRLPWAGQYILNMARTNESLVMMDSRRERLERLIKQLEKVTEDIEAESNIMGEIEKSEQELMRKKKDMLQIRQEEQKLRESCAEIRREIENLSTIKKDNLVEEKNQLLVRKVEIEKELENERRKNDNIEKQVSMLGNSLVTLRSDLGKHEEELRLINREITGIEEEIDNVKNSTAIQLQNLDKQRGELETQKSEALKRVEEAKEQLIEFKNRTTRELEDERLEIEQEHNDVLKSLRIKEEENAAIQAENMLAAERAEKAIEDQAITDKQELKKKYEEIEQKKKALAAEVESYNRKLEAEIGVIEEDIQQKEHEKESLMICKEQKQQKASAVKEELRNLNDEIDKKKKELEEDIQQVIELKKIADGLDKEIIESRRDVESIKISIRNTEILRDDELAKKDELYSKATKLNSEYAHLLEEIRILDKNLKEKDFADQARILEKERSEKEEKLKRFVSTETKIKKINDEIKEVQADQEAAEKRLQDEMFNLQVLQEKRLERLNELKLQIKDLKHNLANYNTQIEELETWMGGIEAEKFRSQSDKLLGRLAMLQEVKSKLEKVLESSWHQDRYSRPTIYIGQIIRDDLGEIEKLLENYRNSLTGVIESLGSEHLD